MKKILKYSSKPLRFTLVMLLICGIVYPLVLTGVSQVIFPNQSNGSMASIADKQVGSTLIGQDFKDEKYLHGRPSAVNYNSYASKEEADKNLPHSGSTNDAPSSSKLETQTQAYLETFLKENPTAKKASVPMDIITPSASGLDPDISVEAAMLQVDRVVKATGLDKERVIGFIEDHTTSKLLGIFGSETVNVLAVNLDIKESLK